ncbi:MAG TPA: FAD-dependent monooxygenase, partial [Ramlibacter sp.]|nr:FAD-dependent monooxygenase [Ramlibacter sp.]
EIRQPAGTMNDWNKPGRLEDVLPIFQDWRFDWLDVPALLAAARQLFEYPMVDKDPVPRWTFGRVTLLGDAAHPMYPRGSNGSAQALVDARVLAGELAAGGEAREALLRYEGQRLPPTARLVEANRTIPPDVIIMKVDALAGGRPFSGTVDALISQDELRRMSDQYKEIAGFSLEAVTRP